MGDDAGDFTISGGVLMFDDVPPTTRRRPTPTETTPTWSPLKAEADGTYMDTQDVMVRVTDVDEMGLTVTGRSSVEYLENRTDSVATYTADGS